MSHRALRLLPIRARRGTGVLIVLFGILFAVALPTVALAAATPGSSGGTPIAASGDATPAPAATPEPGEQGTTETGSGWVRTSPSPAESLAPLMLGAVVLVIMVALIAMSFGESAEARPTRH